MSLHGVLTDIKLTRDLAVAKALGDQCKDFHFTRGDAEALAFFLVRHEGNVRRNEDFLYDDALRSFSQFQAEPDAQCCKSGGDDSAKYFDGMFDNQEAILGPLE